jgi:hypothetical protein
MNTDPSGSATLALTQLNYTYPKPATSHSNMLEPQQQTSQLIHVHLTRGSPSKQATLHPNLDAGSLCVLDHFSVLRIRIRCLFDPWIWDPGWVKDQDPGSGSGMNTDHISEN